MLTLFAMLLKDKIPVEKALELSIESVKIKPFQDELAYAIEEIYRGKMDFSQLHRNFGKDIYVITFLKSSVNNKQLIENTKFITTMLTQEIENKKKHLLKLIEPISIGIIGLMVLLVITKVYLPVFEMFNSMDWMSGF
jgi:type II secretory pathway component PulF